MFDFDEIYDYEKQEAEMIANSGQPTYELTFEVTLKRKFRYQPSSTHDNKPMDVLIADIVTGLTDANNKDAMPWRVDKHGEPEPVSAVLISNKEVCKHCDQIIDDDDNIPCCRRYVREQALKESLKMST